MTFLSPSILWGLAAASIPIIIHLISLKNTREIEFSTLRFIQELEHETLRKLKLRQWLLILLRVLAIIFLVLMFARPVQQGFLSGWEAGERESTVIIILDNSASMAAKIDGTSLLESGKKSIPNILDVFEGKTNVELYQTNPVKNLYDGEPNINTINEILNSVPQAYTADRLFPVVESVITSITASAPNRECFLISDFSRPLDIQELQKLKLKETSWRFYCLGQLPITENLSLREVQAVSQIRLPNHLLKLNTRITNDGKTVKKNHAVELYLNNERLGQVVSTFQPEKTKEFLFQAYPGKSGIIRGKVILPDDDFALDNQWNFELPIPEQIAITLVGNSKEELFLLETALSSIDNQSGFLFIRPQITSSINRLYLDESDVLILHNPGKLSNKAVEDIQTFLRRGGGVLWFAGEQQVALKDNKMEGAVGIPESIDLHKLSGEAYFSVAPKMDDHPILADLNLREIQNELPQIFRYVETKNVINETTILNVGKSHPYLTEIQVHNGTIYYFTSLIDLNWNDLPVRGFMVPILHRILLLLATDESNTKSVVVGETKTIKLDRELINSQWSLETPSGQSILLIPDFNREALNITQTTELGSYNVRSDGYPYTAFSARLSPREYPSNRMPESDVRKFLPNDKTRWIEPSVDLTKELNSIRYGRSLWRIFLILAIITLIIESAVGRTKSEELKQQH